MKQMKNVSLVGKLFVKSERKLEFCKLLTWLGELYGKNISPQLFEIYWWGVEKYSLEEIKRAINLHVLNPDVGQFMPKPADLIRNIEGKNVDKALRAWNKVLNAMRTVGAYESIVFDDSLIHAVIEKLGGWVKFCHTTEKNLPFLFQYFQRCYLVCLSYPLLSIPKRLVGIDEHSARLFGRHFSEPIFFGKNSSDVKNLMENI